MSAYTKLHATLRAMYPKTGVCEDCGRKPSKTEYALVAADYSLRREDYRELCVRCHRRMDLGSAKDAPLCDCHGMPMNKNGRHPGGNQKWRCSHLDNGRKGVRWPT